MSQFNIPVLGFAAFSGTGKTTLLIGLIPLLRDAGIRVSMIKHAHHDFDIDKPGKDSYELRKAGARQILIASDCRRALITEHETPFEPTLQDLVEQLGTDACDLVLVEGFRHVPFRKIELHRPSLGHPLLYPGDDSVIAVASDATIDTGTLPLLDINDVNAIGKFIIDVTGQGANI